MLKFILDLQIDVQAYERIDEKPQRSLYLFSGQDRQILVIEIVRKKHVT